MSKIQKLNYWKIKRINDHQFSIRYCNDTLYDRVVNINKGKHGVSYVELEKCYIDGEYVFIIDFYDKKKKKKRSYYFNHEELIDKLDKIMGRSISY